MSEHREDDVEGETILEGYLTDQAALHGVLNTLYELHLPVLMVECLETSDPRDLTDNPAA